MSTTLAERLVAKRGGRTASAAVAAPPRLMNVAEAARYLGRDRRLIEGAIAEGLLPVVTIGDRAP